MIQKKYFRGGVFLCTIVLCLCVALNFTARAEDLGVDMSAYSLTSSGLAVTCEGATSYDQGSAVCTATDTITVTATGYDDWGAVSSKITLTLTNNNAEEMTLNYTLTHTNLNGGTCSVDAGNYSIQLAGGASHKIVLTSPEVVDGTATITISNIQLKSDASSASMTFLPMDSGVGTYKVDGSVISGTTSIAYTEETTIELPKVDGYRFIGWMVCDSNGNMTSTVYSTAEKFSLGSPATVKPLYVAKDAAEFQVNRVTYYTWEHAMQAAATGDVKTVVVSKSGTLPANATGNVLGSYATGSDGAMTYQLPVGITLLVPYDAKNTENNSNSPSTSSPDGNVFTLKSIDETTAYRTLTVESGVTLNVAGNLNVNSEVFAFGARDTGVPHGPYGLMVLEGGSQVNLLSGGVLACYGYIIGTYDGFGRYTGGKIVAERGAKVYELFQIRDMRGSGGIYDCNGGFLGLGKKCFPLSQYYVQNIEAKYEMKPGVLSYGVLVASTGDGAAQKTDVAFIGESTGLFRLTSGKLTRLYHPVADQIEYTLSDNGTMSLDEISLNLSGVISVKSSDFVLGINGNLSVTVESGTVTINQKVKLLPGAEITVNKNGVLNVASSRGALFLYDSEDWKTGFVMDQYTSDTTIGQDTIQNINNLGTQKNVVRFSPSRQRVVGKVVANTHVSAKLHVDGKLIAYENVYATNAGAASPDNMLTGTGVFELNNGSNYSTTSLNEYYNNSEMQTVAVRPLIGMIVADSTTTLPSTHSQFPNVTAKTTYNGLYFDVAGDGADRSDYMWTTGTPITMHLMHNGEEKGTWNTIAYSDVDLDGYFIDSYFSTPATAQNVGTDLYTKATAYIQRGEDEIYYQVLNDAVTEAEPGDTVNLLCDVTLVKPLVVAKGQGLTLNLNNHSVSYCGVTNAGAVLTNRGILSINGGDVNVATPGKLINTSVTDRTNEVIANYGTINTIGGNLLIKTNGAFAAAVWAHSGTINVIGGSNSNVEVDAKNIGIYTTGGTINYIGGENGKVTVNAAQYPVYVNGGAINTIGGENSSVTITSTVSGWAAINVEAGTLGTIGSGNGTVTVNSPETLLYVRSGGTVNVLGGANSQVILTQNAAASDNPFAVRVEGTLTTVGDTNATVKIIQNSASTKDHGKLVYVTGTIGQIGTAAGSKVLMQQNITSSKTGWGIDVRGGTVGTIGSANSTVEIISWGYPVYTTGTGTIGTVTGNTLMVTQKRDGNYNDILWTVKPIGTISGGYYYAATYNEVDRIFDDATQSAITSAGYQISGSTVSIVSILTEKPYDCYFVTEQHDHVFDGEIVFTWQKVDGGFTATAARKCSVQGCHEYSTPVAVDMTSEMTGSGTEYTVTYTASAEINGLAKTETKSVNYTVNGSRTALYDDRIIGKTSVSILYKGVPTSKQVGSDERDLAVVTMHDGKIIATGIGTALVNIDGQTYVLTVNPAPISLFMITGHSIGMGSKGNKDQSIICEEGQVYSYNATDSLGTNDLTGNKYDSGRVMDDAEVTDDMGLGFASSKRPINVDDLTEAGPGLQGEDSGIAWQWNEETEEKVYIVNAAVGGTCLYNWAYDNEASTPKMIRDNAIKQFQQAQKIIANEIEAGHFTLSRRVLIYHSGANFSYRNHPYSDAEGEKQFELFLDDVCNSLKDFDGDGVDDSLPATADIAIGFVPIWTKGAALPFGEDKPATQFMGASDAYENMFTASLIGREQWGTNEGVQAYAAGFDREYTTQDKVTPTFPTTREELYADNSHYIQVVYNEMGIDIANNVITYFSDAAPTSVKLWTTGGAEFTATEITNMTYGDRLTLVPVVNPISVNDLTFEVSGVLKLEYPLTLSATGAGTGTLTIKHGENILKTITVTVTGTEAVAEIVNGNTYDSVQDAIDAAQNGQTVRLLKDVTQSSGCIVPEGKSITLDLNNHTITTTGAIAGANPTVITNYGTLSITGGVLGDDKVPGKLVHNGKYGILNYKTINTIGGYLTIENTGSSGDAIHMSNKGSSIGVIGGPNSNVTLIAKSYGIYADANTTIGSIGGDNGQVTVTSVNCIVYIGEGAAITAIGGTNANVTLLQENTTTGGKYGIHQLGTIDTIGGTNATVSITQINNYNANVGTIFMDGNAYTETIGGSGATVTIKQDNRISSGNRIALWVYGDSSIKNLGNAGTVNILSNAIGVYVGGNTEDSVIENVANGGTVNIRGFTDENGTKKNGVIGIQVSNTSSDYGIINLGGAGGTVNIDSLAKGIYMSTASSKLKTVGGENSTVNVNATSVAIHVYGGKIESVGSSNAKVNLATTGDNNVIYVQNGSIGTIGSSGTGLVKIDANYRGILILTNSAQVETIGNGNVEINAPAACIWVGEGNKLGVLGGLNGNVTINKTGTSDDYAVKVAGEITTIGGANSSVKIINPKSKGIKLDSANAFIETIGNGGTVSIDSAGDAIHLVAGAEITTIGGANSNVNLESDAIGINLAGAGATITTIGATGTGNVDIDTAGVGISITGSKSKITYLGGENGSLTVNSSKEAVAVQSSAEITYIGGANAKVDLTTNNAGTAKIATLAVTSGGVVQTIGGTNATINIKENLEAGALTSTVYVIGTGSRIENIGGTGANITIEMGGKATSGTRLGIWVYNKGSIGTLGCGGNVTITAPYMAIFTCSSADNLSEYAWIDKIGSAGTVTLNSSIGIAAYGNADAEKPAIGVLGAGGDVVINSKGAGIDMIYGGSRIGTIGQGGTVTINAGTIGINMVRKNAADNTKPATLAAINIGNIGDGGAVTINAGTTGIDMGLTNTSITTIGAGGDVTINAGTVGINLSGAGANIENIGLGGTVEITSVQSCLKVGSGATVTSVGGANSVVKMTQNATGSVYARVIDVAGIITNIGDQNATVKLIQTSNTTGDNGHGKLICVSGTVHNIGTASGSKVLIDQKMLLSSTCGWGLYVTGKIEAIGSADSLVEVIADHCPVYLGGTIGSITGNTVMVGKRDWLANIAMWMGSGKTIGSVTGGYYGVNGGSNINDVFDQANQNKIKENGYVISSEQVPVKSLTTGETYNCFYIHLNHEHVYGDVSFTWVKHEGEMTATALRRCTVNGCTHTTVPVEAAITTEVTLDEPNKKLRADYTGSAIIDDIEYTATTFEEFTYEKVVDARYDDRLTGGIVRVLFAGAPESWKVGSVGTEKDDAVITRKDSKLIATGTGVAVVRMNGQVCLVRVTSAPISLFMITGHSLGMGSRGWKYESVVCEDGQAYSYTLTDYPEEAVQTGTYNPGRLLDSVPDNMGLGYASPERYAEIDAFTASGAGVQGEDSGLAWMWNYLTGEKVFVVNAARGSSSLYQWVTTDFWNETNNNNIRENAIIQFQQAQQMISNEIKAGHFTLSHMAMINHSSANYGYRDVAYNDNQGEEWFQFVMDEMRTALNRDLDGDGVVEDFEKISIGFVPIWSNGATSFTDDKPAVMFMGASDQYPDMFSASMIGREQWRTNNMVKAYFSSYAYPEGVTVQNGTTLTFPQTTAGLYADGVHYTQTIYNVLGMDIAENLYDHFLVTPAEEDVSLDLWMTNGTTLLTEETINLSMTYGERLTLVPVVKPYAVNDLSFDITGNLKLEYPMTLTAKDSIDGTGTLVIKYGNRVLKTIHVTVTGTDAVARVESTGAVYASLQDAINAVGIEPDTVTLLKDVTQSTGVSIHADKDITLNLNNHKLIVTGTIDGLGTAVSATAVTNYGKLSVDGGALDAATPGMIVNAGSYGIYNYGTIDTIGGYLQLGDTGTKGSGIRTTYKGTSIGTVGGADSDVTIIANDYGIYLSDDSCIDTIGGVNGNVTITSASYGVYVNAGASIDTIGATGTGNVEITTNGIGIMVTGSGAKINYLGGENGKLTISSKKNVVNVNSDYNVKILPEVTNIGGTNAEVTLSQDNTGGSTSNDESKYTIFVNHGKIGNIGGTDAKVSITQNNKLATNTSTIFLTGSGRIETIGGEGATIDIVENSTDTTKYHIGLWPNIGTVGILGSGGTVNLKSDKYGIHIGGSGSSTGCIEKIGTAGTVNINADYTAISVSTVDNTKVPYGIITLGAGGEVNITADSAGIYLGSATSRVNTIGLGGTVTINSDASGIKLDASGAKITTVGSGGTVTIDSVGDGIYLAAGAEITTLGSTDSTVTINSDAIGINLAGSGAKIATIGLNGNVTVNSVNEGLFVANGAEVTTIGGKDSKVAFVQHTGSSGNLALMRIEGVISLIGDENAVVKLEQHYEKTSGNANIIHVGNNTSKLDGEIGAIGGKNATILMTQDAPKGIGFGLYVMRGTVGTVGGSNVKRVEIISAYIPIYVSGNSTITEVCDNTLVVAKNYYKSGAVWNAGNITKISGGYYTCKNSTYNKEGYLFEDGASDEYGRAKNLAAIAASGKSISKYTVPVRSIADEKETYECYFLTPTGATSSILYDAVSVSVEGETILNLKFHIPDSYLTDAYTVTVTEEKNTIVPNGNEWTISMAELASLTPGDTLDGYEVKLDNNGRYVFSQGIASGEMTGDVTVTFKKTDGTVVKVYDSNSEQADKLENSIVRTVVDFAELALENGSDELKALTTAMLTYGGYAQNFFGVDTENLASAILTEEQKATVDIENVTQESFDATVTTKGALSGVLPSQIMLDLDSKTTMRVYFTLSNNRTTEGLSVSLAYPVDGKLQNMPLTIHETNDGFYVEVEDIAVAYWDHNYEITITHTDGTMVVTSSVMSWVKNCIKSNINETEVAMAKAMYYYNQAANAYFGK